MMFLTLPMVLAMSLKDFMLTSKPYGSLMASLPGAWLSVVHAVFVKFSLDVNIAVNVFGLCLVVHLVLNGLIVL